MYKKLPKKLYKHKHTKGWNIPGYSTDGFLLFTSKEKAKRYKNSDGGLHGEPNNNDVSLVEQISKENLFKLLQSKIGSSTPSGLPQAVVFNLTNKGKYDGIYDVNELCDLLESEKSFCSAYDYEPEQFKDLLKLYQYQLPLKSKLDSYNHSTIFSQEIINEVVLWKVNRYVNVEPKQDWLSMLNEFKDDKEVLEEKLSEFLKLVLKSDTKGIQLAMASTFLRFRNPKVYQIIDERTYRVVISEGGTDRMPKSYTNIDVQIDLYIQYLKKLKELCLEKQIPFMDADRILYQFDIIKNGDFN